VAMTEANATPASPFRQIEFRLGQLIFVWFSNNGRLAVVIVAAVFLILFILVVVWVPRRHRGVDKAPPREDASDVPRVMFASRRWSRTFTDRV
jgi:hypothetical protein